MQSRRTTISVPGFYNKKKTAKFAPCLAPARQPLVVVQLGGPSLETIRTKMESQGATGRDNDVAKF